MKKLFYVLFALTFLFSGIALADSMIIKFDTGLNATDHWYQRIDTSKNWDDAQVHANSLGGYLATVLSAEEDAFIFDNFNDGGNYWLGGTDTDTEGIWAWETGEGVFWNEATGATALYSDFFAGEPNGSGDYLQYWREDSGQWDDTVISHRGAGNRYIVEWNSNPVPEPVTLLLLGSGLLGIAAMRRNKFFNKQ